jgi:hypothetical protein
VKELLRGVEGVAVGVAEAEEAAELRRLAVLNRIGEALVVLGKVLLRGLMAEKIEEKNVYFTAQRNYFYLHRDAGNGMAFGTAIWDPDLFFGPSLGDDFGTPIFG